MLQPVTSQVLLGVTFTFPHSDIEFLHLGQKSCSGVVLCLATSGTHSVAMPLLLVDMLIPEVRQRLCFVEEKVFTLRCELNTFFFLAPANLSPICALGSSFAVASLPVSIGLPNAS